MTVETLRTPYLLLAAPELSDPNFHQAVVLMGFHTDEGALGWIVNRVLEGGVANLLPDSVKEGLHPDTPLRVGGPVMTPGLIVIHRLPITGVESTALTEGLYLCSSAESLPKLFHERPGKRMPSGLLVFGYAGWGPGQLEREMSEGSWLVLPYEESMAFPEDADTLWARALLRLGISPDRMSAPPAGGVN